MGSMEKKGYISCQGESGSCAFAASRVHFYDYHSAPQPSFEEVIRRVSEGDAKLGLLPYMNSRSGLISEPMRLVEKPSFKLWITGVYDHRIRHHLMVPRRWIESVPAGKERMAMLDALDARLRDNPFDLQAITQKETVARPLLAQLTAIYSDEQGLRQCDRNLKINVVAAERRLTSCTAKAARIIAQEIDTAKHKEAALPPYAAIASEDCASMYENFPLVRDINDDPQNTTRYFSVSTKEPTAADILRDLDIKRLLRASDSRQDLTEEDLAVLFSVEPLKKDLDARRHGYGFDEAAEKSGQLRVAEVHLLRDFLANNSWDQVENVLLGKLPVEARRRIALKLEPIAREIRERVPPKDQKNGALRLLNREYADKVRSIFIIRAKDKKTKQADLLKLLVEGGRRRSTPLNFNVIAELPKPIDAKGEAGVGLIVEADGPLVGAEKRINKKKGSAFGGSGSETSELERALLPIGRIADVRVLGTFAKELNPLGVGALGAVGGSPVEEKKGSALPLPGRDMGAGGPGVGYAPGPTAAGLIAAAFTLLVAGAGLAWYITEHGGF